MVDDFMDQKVVGRLGGARASSAGIDSIGSGARCFHFRGRNYVLHADR